MSEARADTLFPGRPLDTCGMVSDGFTGCPKHTFLPLPPQAQVQGLCRL